MNRDRLWGLQFRSTNLWFLAVVTMIAVLAAALVNRPGYQVIEIAAAAAAVAASLAVVTLRSRTLLGWLWKRLTFQRSPRDEIALFAAETTGHTWDGRRASVYIELLPQPYETTIIGAEQETTIRRIPVDAIREELTQFDIHCDHVTLLTLGYKYDEPSQLATVCHAAVGPVGALLYGRTVLEVSIALDRSLDSVYARQGNDGVAVGLSRTVTIAAERIRRRLSQLGWNARLLSEDDLAALQSQFSGVLIEQLDHEHWGSCGAKAMRASMFTPIRSAWTPASYREWLKLNTHRTLQILRFTRNRDGSDHAEMYVGYLDTDKSALSTVRAIGLRRQYGQQGDILTAAIPAMRTIPTSAVPGKTLSQAEEFPMPLYAAGVGTFIGLTRTRAQVFVNFTVGSEPFYVVAPAALCQQLLLRLATSGRSIDISLPGEEWQVFARRIGATHDRRPDADIVVTAQEGVTKQSHPNQVRLVWTTSEPRRIDYGIVAGPDECVLTTPTGQTRYRWSVSNAEQNVFTLRPRAPRHAATAS
ncbi:type VII secretion protein EccE [Mycobacterium avium subsp. hominissuis]|uniref:Type VII secretion protein EccE n=2 Tax=Mycobacterium avium complex (MAC) TaxID=120793 RepID=A0A2A3LAV8_MYCAV|nr:type VII secretion protein EccE [Mycobacterium avium subsp. hominissuis]PBJ66056.1 type VII secretion protein EccE [Mycobacterium avium subsp. hominissuis]